MNKVILLILVLASAGNTPAQEPLDPDLFQAGIFGDLDRTVTCVSGQAGDSFRQYFWAWVPDDLGLAYITLRLEIPDNLDLSVRPTFHPLVTDFILTHYPDGTQEWNMVFSDCPSGWVQVLDQPCVFFDDQPGEINILADHSMMRDCHFVLNDLTVLNNLHLNDPDCDFVQTSVISWGRAKSMFR